MAFFRIIFFLLLLSPAMMFISGCYDDTFLSTMNEEKDFVAPYDVTLSDNDATRTTHFPITDTGSTTSQHAGDDPSYTDIPAAKSFTESNVSNGGADNGSGSDTDDIVTDNVTNLVWTKCTANGFKSMKKNDDCSDTTVSTEMPWNDAFTTCDSLTYAGYSDWRLPTLPELFTLLDFSGTPLVDLAIFPDTAIADVSQYTWNSLTIPLHAAGYWTRTSRLFVSSNGVDMSDFGWMVYFNMGPYTIFGKFQITNFAEKMHYDSGTGLTTPAMNFVRCVRGGS